MKIPEIEPLQMNISNSLHYGKGKIVPTTQNAFGFSPISSVKGVSKNTEAASISSVNGENTLGTKKTFSDFLLEAVNTVNSQQVEVSTLQEKLITNPDDVEIHDVTLAMSKARMSLNLAQTVIDRLVSGWNEITTTR